MNQPKVHLSLVCHDCGKTFELYETEFLAAFYEQNGYICSDCLDKRKSAREAAEDAAYKAERAERINRNITESGIPDEYMVVTPPVPIVAEWLSARFDANILLHGDTGAGKSTSAGYNARQALYRGFSVRWYMLSTLLDEWRAARKSDNALDVPYLFRRLESYDILILDECDKPINTESTQELMFRLLEDVANGTSHAHVWMLGNWYRGAIENIFGNGAAARRRFDESFQCAEIMNDGKIKKIRLSRGLN